MAITRDNGPVLYVRQGSTFSSSMILRTADGPVDLSGKELVFSSDVADNFHKSTDEINSGFTVTDAVQGKVHLSIPFSVTRQFVFNRVYRYEIELREGTVETVLIAGLLKVVQGVNSDQI